MNLNLDFKNSCPEVGSGGRNDISHVQGVAKNLVLGVCEWYKSCPGGTTNHILGIIHTAVLGGCDMMCDCPGGGGR